MPKILPKIYSLTVCNYDGHADVLFQSPRPLTDNELQNLSQDVLFEALAASIDFDAARMKEEFGAPKPVFFTAMQAFYHLAPETPPDAKFIDAALERRGYKVVKPEKAVYIEDFSCVNEPETPYIQTDENIKSYVLAKNVYSRVLEYIKKAGLRKHELGDGIPEPLPDNAETPETPS